MLSLLSCLCETGSRDLRRVSMVGSVELGEAQKGHPGRAQDRADQDRKSTEMTKAAVCCTAGLL